MVTRRVLVSKTEARKLRKKPNCYGIKVLGQPHGLVTVNDEEMRRLRKMSNRRQGLKVKYRGRTYRAFPRRAEEVPMTNASLDRHLAELESILPLDRANFPAEAEAQDAIRSARLTLRSLMTKIESIHHSGRSRDRSGSDATQGDFAVGGIVGGDLNSDQFYSEMEDLSGRIDFIWEGLDSIESERRAQLARINSYPSEYADQIASPEDRRAEGNRLKRIREIMDVLEKFKEHLEGIQG